MGSSNSGEHTLPEQNWIQVQKNMINMNQSRITFAQNSNQQSENLFKNQNDQYAEKYKIGARQYLSLKEQMEIYYYRYTTKKPLVKVHQVKALKSKGFCSNQDYLEVYQEYIPYRLADLRNLSHDSGLYVLSQAFYGFQELFSKVGSFPVDQHLIGFNHEGKAKVWYNQNFSSNRNPLDGIILMGVNSNYTDLDKKMISHQQYDMVQDIWLAVDKYSLFSQQFRQQNQGFIQCSFNKARKIVQNQIQKRVNVPDRIRFKSSLMQKKSEKIQPTLQKQNNFNNYSISSQNDNNLNQNKNNFQGQVTKKNQPQLYPINQRLQNNNQNQNNMSNFQNQLPNSRVRSQIFQNGQYNKKFNVNGNNNFNNWNNNEINQNNQNNQNYLNNRNYSNINANNNNNYAYNSQNGQRWNNSLGYQNQNQRFSTKFY